MARLPGLRIHHLLPSSRSNGPGMRAVVWTQGCSLGCPGCFNPETHPASRGTCVDPLDLALDLTRLAPGIEGITISGGEPFQHAPALAAMLRMVRRSSNLSILVFTGYTLEELRVFPASDRILGLVDVLIAGRYDHRQRLGRGLVGSANKTIHFLTDRYNAADLSAVPEAEVVIERDGSILLSGILPLTWQPEKKDTIDL